MSMSMIFDIFFDITGNNLSSSEDGLKMWAVSTAITMLHSNAGELHQLKAT